MPSKPQRKAVAKKMKAASKATMRAILPDSMLKRHYWQFSSLLTQGSKGVSGQAV
jgi:hypothetical protein